MKHTNFALYLLKLPKVKVKSNRLQQQCNRTTLASILLIFTISQKRQHMTLLRSPHPKLSENLQAVSG
jgi:hypothetical protein